jgi:hypothetical protein
MKLTLDLKSLADSFFEEAKLIGIMAPMKDYLFCWQLNNILGIDFRINNEIEIQLMKKKREYFFAVYEYAEKTCCLTHYLYNNQFDGEYLLPELKHLDFLWLMKGEEISEQKLQHMTNCVKTIKGVQLVVELTNEKIKHKEHLIF